MRESQPEARRYITVISLRNIAFHSFYAFSATFIPPNAKSGHDFVTLRNLINLNPVVAAVTILVLPILLQGVIYLEEYAST